MANLFELNPTERAKKDVQDFKENYEYIFLSTLFGLALDNSVDKYSRSSQQKMEALEAEFYQMQEEIFSTEENKNFSNFFFEMYKLNDKFQKRKKQIERELRQDVEDDLKRGFINSDVAKILIHLIVGATVVDGEFVQKRFDKFILDFEEKSEKIYEMIQNRLIGFYQSNQNTLNLKHGTFLDLIKQLNQFFSLPSTEIKFEIFGKEKTLEKVLHLYKFETVPFFKSVASIKNCNLVENYISGFSFEEMAERNAWTTNKVIREFKEAAGKIYNKLRKTQLEDERF